MANFNELSGIKQWAAALGVAALITGARAVSSSEHLMMVKVLSRAR